LYALRTVNFIKIL